ncbi:cytochrome c, mono- and diheme variants family protein [Nitzschia inconspicua]|uniref:Cytochrome c-553 n=1 Tax=Nitzschia inconspicua TaxID=303405 RepID=A0A9K3Q7R0_9STRA|nr:cytochrome c, mono- and diheme variants family protein [Nitzschia inconspicua]KAG7374727.1 cytochrome c, mono- and diheme variants family protein [Nitzschia inconspicua]
MKLAVFATLLATASAFSINKADIGKAAAAGAIAFGAAVAPAVAADVGAGEQIFNANCAACHAGGQNVIMPEKTLEKDALEQYLAGGRNAKAIITQVTNGKNAMPAFGGRLDDEAIANVAAYVLETSEAGWD